VQKPLYQISIFKEQGTIRMAGSSETEHNSSNQGSEVGKRLTRKFESVVSRTEKVMLIERATPAIASAAGISAVFLAASWFNLWNNLSAPSRAVGVSLFTAGVLASLYALKNVKRPTRKEVIDRIDKASPVPHRPATVLNDTLTELNAHNSVGGQIWTLHQDRIKKEIGNLKSGWPREKLNAYDPYMVLRVLPVLLGATGFMLAQGEHYERTAKAFDWKSPVVASAPPVVNAWISPPEYTGKEQTLLSSDAKNVLAIRSLSKTTPEGSILTLRFNGESINLNHSGEIRPVTDEERIYYVRPSDKSTLERQFYISGNADISLQTNSGETIKWSFNSIEDMPPRLEAKTRPDTAEETGKSSSVTINYKLEDEYRGAQISEIEISPNTNGSANKSRPKKPLLGAPAVTLKLK
jgi:hypothetical protein